MVLDPAIGSRMSPLYIKSQHMSNYSVVRLEILPPHPSCGEIQIGMVPFLPSPLIHCRYI